MGDEWNFELKKKKKKKCVTDDTPSAATSTTIAETTQQAKADDPPPTYTEMLERVYSLIGNTDTPATRKVIIPPPQVVKHGTKRVAFMNFAHTCKCLRRPPAHLQQFIDSELASTTSIDGNNCLIIKGRYDTLQMQGILRRYAQRYVMCQSCKSPETTLRREGRMTRMRCDTCTSETTVEEIHVGYHAQVAHRTT